MVSQPARVAQPAQAAVSQKKTVTPVPAPVTSKEEALKKEDSRPIDELLDFIEGGSNSQPKTVDSKKAAKRARQKQKKVGVNQFLTSY